MVAPNNPAVARVALEVLRDSRTFVNTFHIMRSDNAVLTVADLAAINAVFSDWWANSYRAALKNVIVGSKLVATKLDPAAPFQDTLSLASPGTYASGGATAADVSAAVSWRTGLAGRKFRGRFFDFGVPTDAFTTNDTMTGAYITILSSVGTYLLSHLGTAALKAVIFHRLTNTATPITGVVVDQLLDSMRMRLAGRGI